MAYSVDFTKRIYCLITGASRGIGRTIAVELARRACKKFTLVLLARSESGLLESKILIEKAANNPNVTVLTKVVDLSKVTASHFENIMQETFNKQQSNDYYESAMIFHNAGQIGNVGKTIELADNKIWREYYDLNVFSVAVLNSVFLKTITQNKTMPIRHVFVINVTSLLGRKAFKYLSMYGSGKAARDLYFKVLAEEEPDIVVLNYSPGMVETAMANELISNIQSFEDSEILAATKINPTKLTPEQTITKLMTLLEKGQYQSGDIIDYYDNE